METRRVLIVDDRLSGPADIAAALHAGLLPGCAVERLADADEALRRCDEESAPDCLVLVQHPGGPDAAALLARLPRTPEGLPCTAVVVVRAAGAAPGEGRELLRAGAQDVLGGDLPPAALALAIDNAIERHALAREAAARLRALQDSEAHYRHTVEFNPQLPWSADPLGRLVDCSSRWLEQVGLTRGQALADGWARVLHPSDQPLMEHAWEQALRSGEPLDIEHRIRLADGGYRWMRSRAVPRRDAAGRILRWYGMTEDIDDRKQAEYALRLSEERFRELADNISQLAWAADGDGWIYWFNRRWFDYTGMGQEQAVGGGWLQALHPEHRERVLAGLQRCWDSGEPWEDLLPLRGRDGGWRWFLSRATPVRAADGSVLRWCGTHTDVTDQRATEAALRSSEARFRVALSHAPVTVYEQDLELRYRWICNPAGDRDAGRLVGCRAHDVFPAEEAQALDDLKRHAIATGRTVRQEVAVHCDGERKWLDLTVEPMRDAEGRVCGVICSAIDRSESKRTELALQESEERLQLALQVARGYVFDWDPASDTVIRSEGFGAILGLPGLDAHRHYQSSTEEYLRHVHPEDRAVLRQALRELGPARPGYVLQYRVLGSGGRVVTLEAVARGSFDADGRLLRLVGMCVDVTQRARAEALLRRREHELQTLADNTPDMLARFDPELRCSFVNAAVERATGRPRAQFLGATLRGMGLAPRLCARGEAALREVFAGGEPRTLDFRLPGRDGVRHYSGRLVAERDADGRVAQVLGVAHDVSDQRRMEREREELLTAERAARTELERVAQLKDQFLATLSHELRTPLNAIVGWTHLLGRPGVEPALLRQGLDVIGRNARLQTQLIDDLLDMNRILAGKFALELQPLDAAAVAAAAVDSLRVAAEKKGVALTLRPAAGLPPLRGDARRLQQVVSNLINNALKFTPAGGRVEVSIAADGPQLLIVVEDSGQGIDPRFLPHLFERFSQADASAARAHDGLGLGLSIVRHLVELHGGSVSAESEGPGRGARFTVRLPVAPSGEMQAAVPAAAGPAAAAAPMLPEAGPGEAARGSALDGLTVLLVDDQPDALEPLRRLLKEHGARVWTAGSGFEALECLRHERPDLLVSDIGMPGMDGYRLIREVRERFGPEELPALALTAFSRAEDRLKALGAGFQAHLVKPFEPQAVLALVVRLSRRPAAVSPGA